MDREVLRLLAHADQTRSVMREVLGDLSSDGKAALVRRCAAGDLGSFDERTALLAGVLAIVAIFDLMERKEEP